MKKIFSLFLIALMLVSVSACNKKTTNYSKDVETVKNIFDNMNGKPFSRNGFGVYVDQKYNIEAHIDNEDEKTDYTYNYEGYGIFTILTEDTNFSGNLSDVLSSGNGYVNAHQYEKISYVGSELNKIDNVLEDEEYNYEITQDFEMKSYDNNLFVSQHAVYKDEIEDDDYENSFNGLINKELIDNNVSSDFINQLFERLIFMDGYNNINSIEATPVGGEEYTYDQVKKLLDDGVISLDCNDNSITLNFIMNFKELINIATETTDSNDAEVTIKMEFKNDDYELISLNYDLKNFFNEMLNVVDDDDEVTNTIEKYNLTAIKFDKKISEIDMVGEFQTYTDSEEFLNDFSNNLDALSALIR